MVDIMLESDYRGTFQGLCECIMATSLAKIPGVEVEVEGLGGAIDFSIFDVFLELTPHSQSRDIHTM
jgi:hypothetical protein